MGEILIGTCSWTDPTLIESGRFYPATVRSSGERLNYYAGQFRLVEVDSSYYALPGDRTAGLWTERTGAEFVFDLKAFRLFTQHPTPLDALPKDIRSALPAPIKEKSKVYQDELPQELVTELWTRFESALLPLNSAGKLGVVLFQFPPWFYPGNKQRDYILACRERLSEYRIAVEFRHNSWLNEKNKNKTLEFLRDNNLPFVCVDEPQGFPSSVPPLTEVTSEDLGLVRFHGRNRDTWEKKGISPAERFNYLYSETELQEWVPQIKRLAAGTRQFHILFNNCYQDKALVNARQIRLMLDEK